MKKRMVISLFHMNATNAEMPIPKKVLSKGIWKMITVKKSNEKYAKGKTVADKNPTPARSQKTKNAKSSKRTIIRIFEGI
jgi:hypothetical protein